MSHTKNLFSALSDESEKKSNNNQVAKKKGKKKSTPLVLFPTPTTVPLNSQPIQKPPKVELTEDEELQAAIKASLAESQKQAASVIKPSPSPTISTATPVISKPQQNAPIIIKPNSPAQQVSAVAPQKPASSSGAWGSQASTISILTENPVQNPVNNKPIVINGSAARPTQPQAPPATTTSMPHNHIKNNQPIVEVISSSSHDESEIHNTHIVPTHLDTSFIDEDQDDQRSSISASTSSNGSTRVSSNNILPVSVPTSNHILPVSVPTTHLSNDNPAPIGSNIVNPSSPVPSVPVFSIPPQLLAAMEASEKRLTALETHNTQLETNVSALISANRQLELSVLSLKSTVDDLSSENTFLRMQMQDLIAKLMYLFQNTIPTTESTQFNTPSYNTHHQMQSNQYQHQQHMSPNTSTQPHIQSHIQSHSHLVQTHYAHTEPYRE